MSASLVVPVLAASLIGSLHCAGMCGGFVAFYSGGDDNTGAARALGHAAYSLGRLVTYTTLGAVAGSLGAALDLASRAAGMGRVAAVVAGSVMVLWGFALLFAHAGLRVPRLPLARRVQGRVAQAIASLRGEPPVIRALLVGLSSTLLPCGWLYAFAVTAAGTGSALGGATVMIAFWAGTLPVLLGLGIGVQALMGRVRRFVPVLSAALLIIVGLAGVLGRLDAPIGAMRDARAALGGVPAAPPCGARRGAP